MNDYLIEMFSKAHHQSGLRRQVHHPSIARIQPRRPATR